jgi:rhodanese-related sulfurtransferase
MPGPAAVDVLLERAQSQLDPTSPDRAPLDIGHQTRVIVVCNEGYNSSLAAATLRVLGPTRATDLVGGYQAWRHLAHP